MANDKIIGRDNVLEVLGMVPKRKLSDDMLKDALDRILPEPVDEERELRPWIEWNQSKGFIDYEYNSRQERDEWFITKRGLSELAARRKRS